jgi:4-hydroxybenzoate polyprenyltransferase
MQENRIKNVQAIGLFLVGLGSIITTLTYIYSLLEYFYIVGMIVFLIGTFYFWKSEIMRRQNKHIIKQ